MASHEAHGFDGAVRAKFNTSSPVTMHLPTTKFSESQHVISKGSSDWASRAVFYTCSVTCHR
jgi:hypothetical protein